MIAIQIILIIFFLLLMLRFLSLRGTNQTKAWKKIILLLLILAAIVAVLSPELMNKLAHLVGVGRGADLLLYAITVAFIFQAFNNYIKTKDEQKNIVVLARKIAIIEARNRKHQS